MSDAVRNHDSCVPGFPIKLRNWSSLEFILLDIPKDISLYRLDGQHFTSAKQGSSRTKCMGGVPGRIPDAPPVHLIRANTGEFSVKSEGLPPASLEDAESLEFSRISSLFVLGGL